MAERRRNSVYRWQWEWYHWDNQQFSSIARARLWVKHAMECYGIKGIPTVRAKRKGTTSFFRPIDWSIHLLPVHWNAAMALHEAAHAIYFYFYGDNDDDHDEKWLGIFVWLLVNSKLWPKEAIYASLKARNIAWSRMMSPKVLKRKIPAVKFTNLK